MSDPTPADGEPTAETVSQPEFRGCVFCYSAEWALYAGRKARQKLPV